MASILICDDEKIARDLLCEYLSIYGYEVFEACDGEQCLKMLTSIQPDAILLDMKMPKLDGVGVLRCLNERDSTIPVLVLTGFGGAESERQVLALGARGYLQKPMEPREVALRIEKVLQQNGPLPQRGAKTPPFLLA